MKQVLLALETIPMNTLHTINSVTYHAGVVLKGAGWNGTLASEILRLSSDQPKYMEISYLEVDGTHFNGKGQSRTDILDGRYSILNGARSQDGIGNIVAYNSSHLDNELLAQITLRLDSIVEVLQIQETTQAAKQSHCMPQRRI